MRTQHTHGEEHSIDDLARLVQGVHGWMSLSELWTLFNLVRELDVRGRPVTVVEIGAWQGRSTIALALSIRSRGSGLLYSIDPHFGGLSYGVTDTYPLLVSNLRRTKLTDLVQVVRATSRGAFGEWAKGNVDLIVHDGSDQYGEVLEELNDWQSTLAIGATVVVVDPFKKGVLQALEKTILSWRSPYARPRMFWNLLVTSYRPDARGGLVDVARRFGVWLRIRMWSYVISAVHHSPPSFQRMLHRIRYR